MSSIYLYIIYISRPWFKGSGAALHGGRSENGRQRIQIRNIHSLMPPSAAMLLVGKNGCVPKDFNQKHAGCRETSGVFCCERGSRFKVQGSRFRVVGCGGGFAEILRLRSQLFWHSLSHMRRFSPLRMTKRGDARKWYVSHKSLGAPNP